MTGHHDHDDIDTLSVIHPRLQAATLVVGDVSRWRCEGRAMPSIVGVSFVGISDLTARTLCETGASIILSPLVGDDFDVVDVAHTLKLLGFRGRYRAISEDLPDAELIREEIRAFAPDLDFDLLLMPLEQAIN